MSKMQLIYFYLLLFANLASCQTDLYKQSICIGQLPIIPGFSIEGYKERYHLDVSYIPGYEEGTVWVQMGDFHIKTDSLPDPYYLESVRVVKALGDSEVVLVTYYFDLIDFENIDEVSLFLRHLHEKHYFCIHELEIYINNPEFGEWSIEQEGYVITFSLEAIGWYRFMIQIKQSE